MEKEKSGALKDIARTTALDAMVVFSQKTESMYLRMCYGVIRLPWPLTSRDLSYVSSYQFKEDGSRNENETERRGGGRIFVGYTYSSDIIPERPGFVRAQVKYQGYVVSPVEASSTSCTITWLANLHFGGQVPTMFVKQGLLRLMALPRTKGEEALAWAEEQKASAPGGSTAEEDGEGGGKGEHSNSKGAAGKKSVLEEEIRELKRVLADRDATYAAVLAKKDALIKEKDATIMELRRRIPRKG